MRNVFNVFCAALSLAAAATLTSRHIALLSKSARLCWFIQVSTLWRNDMSSFRICLPNPNDPLHPKKCRDIPVLIDKWRRERHPNFEVLLPAEWEGMHDWAKDLVRLQHFDGLVSTINDDKARLKLHDAIRGVAAEVVANNVSQATFHFDSDPLFR